MDLFAKLTERQTQILKVIIEEYLQTAVPVGSETLEKKYNLGVSPATVRNEMVRLSDMGLLRQTHTSAGRSPTPLGLRLYVDHIMKTKDMSLAEEVAVKERVWDYREEVDKLLREATKALAEKTSALALTTTKEGDLYYAGIAHILDMPEFFDYDLTHSLFETLEQFDYWWGLLEGRADSFAVILGEEMGSKPTLRGCGYVYRKFKTPHVSGAIGVVGPCRINFPRVVPVVRYMGELIDEFMKSL